MQSTVKTTNRIRQDLFEQSKRPPFKRDTSVKAGKLMREIDAFRQKLANRKIDTKGLVLQSK